MSEVDANLVKLSIDGKDISVPRGTTIIEAAKKVAGYNPAKDEIPHYCYHENLSIVGNCRMCQVEVEGAPKLMIACHTQVQPDMVVKTHLTSDVVKKAQEDTLELILINHPLDCTVCDQAGQCKLQDYHYDYNAQESRFVEEKERKPKAVELGPNVMLDGERCIMCTRCIRFCDEVTKTSEIGMLNRGDKSVIAVHEGKPLDNELSGTVVDLCPVGALTHKNWRFNTRIWFTKQVDAICTGCSTGCNVKVATRDNQVVQVKARNNQDVNKEWLCDEGRYGFNRFIPESQIQKSIVSGNEVLKEEAVKSLGALKAKPALVFISPDLLLEDYNVIANFLNEFCPDSKISVAYKERELSEVQKILVSADYASNFRGAQFVKLISDSPESQYKANLETLKSGDFENIIILGDRAILDEDLSEDILGKISSANFSLALISDGELKIKDSVKVVIPVKTVLQKSGLLVNQNNKLQYTNQILDSDINLSSEWSVINEISASFGKKLISSENDREMTLEFLSSFEKLKEYKIKDIKEGRVDSSWNI